MTLPEICELDQQTVGGLLRDAQLILAPTRRPDKAAQLVLQIPDMDDPPVRLLLGSEAYPYATAQLASDKRVAGADSIHDHDDATSAELDPLGAHTKSRGLTRAKRTELRPLKSVHDDKG